MKQLLIAIAAAVATSGCQTAATIEPARQEEGVTKELAEHRKQTISDLRYDLSFHIPASRQESVEGELTLRFDLDGAEQVTLDFKAADRQLRGITVNGQEARCEKTGEHVIIPRKLLAEGENTVSMEFTAGDQSLNRNDDFLYTLLVPDRARTLFPCFDQPNMKATFTLRLDVPAEWQAISNTNVAKESIKGSRKTIAFAPTEPLSTYLFSFVAGKLFSRSYRDGDRTINAYYRETDPEKVAQLDTIFSQVAAALRWQEEYTGVAYPFAKYDFIILPGFQFGGMEHTGATLYNDRQMFLGSNATPDEELSRAQLIAHETSHMWFGDYVTMDWFDDVWTKEVFANYYAARIAAPLFPNVNHRLNWMMSYTAPALQQDRTAGTTAIQQPLGNLQDAGLIYNQIVYDKAPVMMEKIVELMGEEPFRRGVREYLSTYAYGNATWDDLIRILDRHTAHDLKAFSDVWVKQKGMPHIEFSLDNDALTVRQSDPYGRHLVWRQQFAARLLSQRNDTIINIALSDSVEKIPLPFTADKILPNTDGRAYGLLIPPAASLDYIEAHWQDATDETERMSLLMLLAENYHAKRIAHREWAGIIIKGLRHESNALIASTLASNLAMPLKALPLPESETIETELFALAKAHPLPSCRTQLMRLLIASAKGESTTAKLHDVWRHQSDSSLNERDYTTLAYELAVRLPRESQKILAAERQRITNPDRLRQFDFISRAAVADTASRDSLFRQLLLPENRRIEPWAASALYYLNHPSRRDYAVRYIRPALEVLAEVQKTGDIFFPSSWASALLRGHTSQEAWHEVEAFLASRPDYPQLLKNKILQAAYFLQREHGGKE